MTTDAPIGTGPQKTRALDVLVVDDEDSVLSVVEQLTVALGHNARVADSARTALEILEAGACDVVISDIRMPQMDGFELAKRIRASHPDMQIILMTGYALDQTSEMAMKLDVAGFLHKPFKARDLDEVLGQISRRVN